ncbi:MAG: hypothetical protein ACXVBL_07620 [Bdellovibrionota bacterium]
MEFDGRELKRMQKIFRLTPTEVAFEAGMSTSNLRKVYANEAPIETRRMVSKAIETCRQKMAILVNSKAAS